MLFLLFVFVSWFFYVRGNKVLAYLIFFFFVTSGFQLVPEESMKLMTGFSKGTDYAVVLMGGCVILDIVLVKGYLRRDTLFKWMIAFYVFLFACILYSRFQVQCTWNEIIRTSRIYSLFLVYLVFRNMTKAELKQLLNLLFFINLFLSCLYLLQIVLNTEILTEAGLSTVKIGDFEYTRYYNQPYMLHFFALMAIYKNPLRGLPRLFSILILLMAIFGAFHRSLSMLFIGMLILGYILQLPKVKQMKVVIVSLAIFIPTIAIVGNKFVKSRTYKDLQLVLAGNFMDADVDLEELMASTFTFRLGHLFERVQFLTETPVAQVFGAGLIAEDSKRTDTMFDFAIGLAEDLTGRTVQLETSDIAYSVLIMRFGYVGTFFFMMIYFYMIYFCYKKRENKHAFSSFLFLVMSILLAFFSSSILYPVTYLLPLIIINYVNKSEPVEDVDATLQEGGC